MLMKSLLLGSAAFLPLFNTPDEGAAGGDPPAAGEDTAAAGDPPAAGEGGDPPAADGAAAAAADGAAAAGDDKPAAEDWRDREIRRKHAQLQESKRREAEKDAELEALRAIAARTGGDDTGDPPAKPAAKTGEIPRELRDQAVAQVRFDESANNADKSGRERYGADWKAATSNLELKGGFDIETMNGILATDDPAKVLYELGKNPDRYDEVMALPPHKRLAEMVKISLKADPKPKGDPKPSEAEAPPSPIRAKQSVDTNLRDDLDDPTWYARRAEQKRKRYEARQAGRA